MTADMRQLEDLRQAAYGLGLGFARAAEAEGDLDRKLVLFDAFQRGFASVRLSIALAMRLRAEARRPATPEFERAEVERDEALERPDHRECPDPPERPERYDERDRERETERASLPLLLRTLTAVADDARALTPQAAELPALTELLDRIRAQPALVTPPPSGALRTRLAVGTAAFTPPPTTRAGHPPPGLPSAAPRRSTGPP